MRFLAVLCVRNEAAFLLEWLAHHRAVGFTDFLVLSNDCDDGTDRMLDHLQERGDLSHLRNDPPHKGGIQFAGMKRADSHPLVAEADWIMALDIDEFVNIHVGDRTLPALLAALPEATAITLTWRLFGNNDVVHYDDAPVTGQFLHAAPGITYWPWRASMFKTLFRNDGIYRKLGIHRPRAPDKSRLDQARWFDGRGEELHGPFKTRRLFSPFGRDNTPLVQLNHYPLGAMESFVLKAARGRAVHGGHALGMDYWVERNFNQHEDRSIQALAPAVQAGIDALKSDPDLRALHDQAVAWRGAQFAALMRQEPFRALFGRLLMTPPSRLVTPESAQTLFHYARIGQQHADQDRD